MCMSRKPSTAHAKHKHEHETRSPIDEFWNMKRVSHKGAFINHIALVSQDRRAKPQVYEHRLEIHCTLLEISVTLIVWGGA